MGRRLWWLPSPVAAESDLCIPSSAHRRTAGLLCDSLRNFDPSACSIHSLGGLQLQLVTVPLCDGVCSLMGHQESDIVHLGPSPLRVPECRCTLLGDVFKHTKSTRKH